MIVAKEEQLAKLFGYSERYIREIFKEEKIEPGIYNLMRCVKKFVAQAKGDSGTYVSQKIMAEILGVSERTVRKLTEIKTLIANEGKYELKENVKLYLQSKDEIMKQKKAQREMTEFKLKVYKDQFHKDEIVDEVISEMIMKFRGKLISCIRKIDNELELNDNTNRKKIIKKNILLTLSELSKLKVVSNVEKLKKEVQ